MERARKYREIDFECVVRCRTSCPDPRTTWEGCSAKPSEKKKARREKRVYFSVKSTFVLFFVFSCHSTYVDGLCILLVHIHVYIIYYLFIYFTCCCKQGLMLCVSYCFFFVLICKKGSGAKIRRKGTGRSVSLCAMGRKKRVASHAIKSILMKEKSLAQKKKREMDGYQDTPEPVLSQVKDEAAVRFQRNQLTVAAPMQTNMFLSFNKSLGPPFHIWLDTNFINFSMQNKIEIVEGLMDCMLAKVIPCVCDCVMAELEKLGKKFRIALKIARDKRFRRLTCDGKYADDCVVRTVTRHPIYIVATCDQELKRRLRKIPGVPIMYISKHRYTIERLPEVYGAPG